jgi:prenyltransferase beta subunit
LRQRGADSPECRRAIARAVNWVLRCRNTDGGFGHFPGSTSDADAIYFQVGVLVMGGILQPVHPLPPEPDLLSWGHLMPPPKN